MAYRYIINTTVVFKGELLVNQICKYEVSSIKLLVKLGVTSLNGRGTLLVSLLKVAGRYVFIMWYML